MPGRKYSSSSSSYRYGFNGKEKDSETKTQDYGMRIYNPSLGRFLSVDPIAKIYPELTPYQFASNRPIDGIDLDGLEWALTTSSTYSKKALISKTNEFTVKLIVVNHSNLSDEEVKSKISSMETGVEKILQNKFVTKNNPLEINNSVNVEFIFDTRENSNKSFASNNAFTLEVKNTIPRDYGDAVNATVTLGRTKTIGNMQNNNIELAIDEEISGRILNEKFTVQNPPTRQTKSLSEEILHTAGLGHVGIKTIGDRPDETDTDIKMFTPALDGSTNVMIQQGQNGTNSTTNVFQFRKVEENARKQLGDKVKDTTLINK